MHPTIFEEQNMVFVKPAEMTDEQCKSLPVWKGNDDAGFPLIVSCWQLTDEELTMVKETGKIWLGVTANVQPPIWLMVEKPFVKK